MDFDEIKAFLTQRGAKVEEKDIPYGRQLRCKSGEVVSLYDSGKAVVQGKATALRGDLKSWLDGQDETEGPSTATTLDGGVPVLSGVNKEVFVVYGHDLAAREQLELLLRRLGMKPIVLANMTPGGDTIIEKLEKALIENSQVQFACVLLTPDDQGHSAGDPERMQYRARQNVVLELGMVIGRLSRRRVAIFHKESVELPSDINGMIYIPFKERVGEQANMLFKVLDEAGYHPDKSGL